MGARVGSFLGVSKEGMVVGETDGPAVGTADGSKLGEHVDGVTLGSTEGSQVGVRVGAWDGYCEGRSEGGFDGGSTGANECTGATDGESLASMLVGSNVGLRFGSCVGDVDTDARVDGWCDGRSTDGVPDMASVGVAENAADGQIVDPVEGSNIGTLLGGVLVDMTDGEAEKACGSGAVPSVGETLGNPVIVTEGNTVVVCVGI